MIRLCKIAVFCEECKREKTRFRMMIYPLMRLLPTDIFAVIKLPVMYYFRMSLFLFIGLAAVLGAAGRTVTPDSANVAVTQLLALGKQLTVLKTDLDTVKTRVAADATKAAGGKSAGAARYRALDFGEWTLVFSPIWLFAITMVAAGIALKKFPIEDALSENEFVKKTVENPAYSAANVVAIAGTSAVGSLATLLPPTIEESSDQLPKSSSRYLALLTSLLAFMIGLALSSFFLYSYMATSEAPSLSGMSTVLLSMGIGVVPYAFNKVSSAVK